MKYSVTQHFDINPETIFSEIRKAARGHDRGIITTAIRNLFAKEFADTINWTSYDGPELEGTLSRAWGKYYAAYKIKFTCSGHRVTTTLSEPDWLATARWPIYIITAIIPPLWWLFFFNFVIHMSSKIGMPRMVKLISDRFLTLATMQSQVS